MANGENSWKIQKKTLYLAPLMILLAELTCRKPYVYYWTDGIVQCIRKVNIFFNTIPRNFTRITPCFVFISFLFVLGSVEVDENFNLIAAS